MKALNRNVGAGADKKFDFALRAKKFSSKWLRSTDCTSQKSHNVYFSMVDKMASYVARNGRSFEEVVRSKDENRKGQ